MKYRQENELDFNGIQYPIKLKDVLSFKKLNNISVNFVYLG